MLTKILLCACFYIDQPTVHVPVLHNKLYNHLLFSDHVSY